MLVDGDKLTLILGISRATIDRLVKTGKLPSVLVGRRRLYRPEDCVLALAKASQRSGGEAQ
jgi:excisionase family DNA binding protein